MSGNTLLLDAKLDLRAAATLKDQMLAHRGQDLALNAVEVTQLGALCLQVIQSAAKTWQQDGFNLTFINASSDCVDQIGLLGFSPQTICQREAV